MIILSAKLHSALSTSFFYTYENFAVTVKCFEVEGHVSLLKDESDGGFKIGVKLIVTAGGVEKEKAKELVEAAHDFCPYSKATRGNIDVNLEVK